MGLDQYAFYVLGSYFSTAAIMSALVIWIVSRNVRVRRELHALEARRAARSKR